MQGRFGAPFFVSGRTPKVLQPTLSVRNGYCVDSEPR